jgi:hypothetical protein
MIQRAGAILEKETQGGASMMQIKTTEIVRILKTMRCNRRA